MSAVLCKAGAIAPQWRAFAAASFGIFCCLLGLVIAGSSPTVTGFVLGPLLLALLGSLGIYILVRNIINTALRLRSQVQESRAVTRTIVRDAPEGILVCRKDGSIATTNPAFEQMFGYRENELCGQKMQRFFVSDELERGPGLERLIERRLQDGKLLLELNARRKDGSTFPVEFSTAVIKDGEEQLLVAFVRNMTRRKQYEDYLKKSLRDKEMLLREIHHRVKNNLQVISSLLKLQSKHLQEESMRRHLLESQSRVRSIALVHELLYQHPDLSEINFSAYLQRLCSKLVSVHEMGNKVCVTINVGAQNLDLDLAIPCGLLVNELVSNALKHAFPDGRSGEIVVDLGEHDGFFILNIRDNGVGLDAHIDFEKRASLGLKLVASLVKQLNGSLERGNGIGTNFRIVFPNAFNQGRERDAKETYLSC